MAKKKTKFIRIEEDAWQLAVGHVAITRQTLQGFCSQAITSACAPSSIQPQQIHPAAGDNNPVAIRNRPNTEAY